MRFSLYFHFLGHVSPEEMLAPCFCAPMDVETQLCYVARGRMNDYRAQAHSQDQSLSFELSKNYYAKVVENKGGGGAIVKEEDQQSQAMKVP